jgi:hypothetical protein
VNISCPICHTDNMMVCYHSIDKYEVKYGSEFRRLLETRVFIRGNPRKYILLIDGLVWLDKNKIESFLLLV